MNVADQLVEYVFSAQLDAVLVAAEDAEKSARPRVPVHEKLEEILGAVVFGEAVVAELDFVLAHIVRQRQNEVAERGPAVEHDFGDLHLVETQ